ncbi:energy transducer TonB [Corallococcus carmarthensis]|nr:energy transducer TonB [Corallococcus carmarthensis]NOK19069.1 hypothetical protein [Corallococcus carmarthensis]
MSMAKDEMAEKAKFLCLHGMVPFTTLSRFPEGGRPEDYVRAEDVAYLRAHPEVDEGLAKRFDAEFPPGPVQCEVTSTHVAGDSAIVLLRRTHLEKGVSQDTGVPFFGTPAGWRHSAFVPEMTEIGFRAAQQNIELLRSGVTPPKKVSGPGFPYTHAAEKVQAQGLLYMMCLVTRQGTAGNCEIIKAMPYGLTEEAVAAVRASRFQPAMLDGQPVDAMLPIMYLFRPPSR